MIEEEMVRWHHQLNGHEFEQAPGVDDGLFATPWIAAHQTSLSITNSWSLLNINIQPSHPLSSPSLPAFNLPSIRVF